MENPYMYFQTRYFCRFDKEINAEPDIYKYKTWCQEFHLVLVHVRYMVLTNQLIMTTNFKCENILINYLTNLDIHTTKLVCILIKYKLL